MIFSGCLLLAACSRKHQPQAESAATATKSENTGTNTRVVKKVPRISLPKVITVDDRAAKKAVDGRLYYDLEGKRYWRNYDDGKYYLYNKNMYNDPAFKPH